MPQGTGKRAGNAAAAPCSATTRITAEITREGDLYISRAREIDVTSFGETRNEALDMLREACELYFEPPAGSVPTLHVEIEVA